jgi:hypothetical protein
MTARLIPRATEGGGTAGALTAEREAKNRSPQTE